MNVTLIQDEQKKLFLEEKKKMISSEKKIAANRLGFPLSSV